MATNLLDRIRLRITPAGPPNRWNTDQLNNDVFWRKSLNITSTIDYSSGESFADTTGGAGSCQVVSQWYPCTAGQYVGFGVDVYSRWRTGLSMTAALSFATAWTPTSHADTSVAGVAPIDFSDPGLGGIPVTKRTVTTSAVVPAGQSWVRVTLTMAASGLATRQDYWTKPATLIQDPDPAVAALLVAAGPAQDLSGQSVSITCTRGGALSGVVDTVEPGILTAVIKGADMDPAVNAALRPGGKVTFEGYGSGGWKRAFTGKVVDADVDYAGDVPKVTVTAVDYVSVLANTDAPLAKIGSNFRQRIDWLMSYVRNPNYVVTDSAGTGALVDGSRDDNGKLLDQLLLTRDTEHGQMWVDRDGQLVCKASNSLPSVVPVRTYSDTFADVGAVYYTDVHQSFSSKACVNALQLQYASLTQDVTYGPYRNLPSINVWDENLASVRVNNPAATLATQTAAKASHHGYFLKLYPAPVRFVDRVTHNATQELDDALVRELYEAIRVKKGALIDSTVRVLRITHTVTATRDNPERGRWITELGCRQLEATAAVVVTAPPVAGTRDPEYPDSTEGNVSPAALEPLASRQQAANFVAAGSSAVTSVQWDTSVTASEGLTWDNTNRWFVVPKAGRYLIHSWGLLLGTSAQFVYLTIMVNGVERTRDFELVDAGLYVGADVSDVLRLAAGDHIQIGTGQTGAATMMITGGADHRAGVTVTYLGG